MQHYFLSFNAVVFSFYLQPISFAAVKFLSPEPQPEVLRPLAQAFRRESIASGGEWGGGRGGVSVGGQ